MQNTVKSSIKSCSLFHILTVFSDIVTPLVPYMCPCADVQRTEAVALAVLASHLCKYVSLWKLNAVFDQIKRCS